MAGWRWSLFEAIGAGDDAQAAWNRRAAEAYDGAYTGRWFDLLPDRSRPNEITPDDLVAVSMLGVTVPARPAAWLLGPGSAEVSDLLAQVPADGAIWEVDDEVLADGSPADQLWHLLRRCSWPIESASNDIGPVIAGKIVASKRPALIPIYDQFVAGHLGLPEGGGFWLSMRAALKDADTRARVSAAVAPAMTVGGSGVTRSLLRAIDVVLWMRAGGYADAPQLGAPDDAGRWTEQELAAAVEAYVRLLEAQEAAAPLNKTELAMEYLQGPLHRRTRRSFESRMMNLSHVFADLGLGTVDGYKPQPHVGPGVQAKLVEIIRSRGLTQ